MSRTHWEPTEMFWKMESNWNCLSRRILSFFWRPRSSAWTIETKKNCTHTYILPISSHRKTATQNSILTKIRILRSSYRAPDLRKAHVYPIVYLLLFRFSENMVKWCVNSMREEKGIRKGTMPIYWNSTKNICFASRSALMERQSISMRSTLFGISIESSSFIYVWPIDGIDRAKCDCST